jgi:hypothetical protein
VSSRQPGGRLRATVAERRRKLVIALDDPGPALADLVRRGDGDLAAAIQSIAGSCAALIDHHAMPGALLLHRDRDWPWAATTVGAIAEHLQLALSVDDIADLAAGQAAPESAAERQSAATAWWNQLADAERELAGGAIEPFIRYQQTGDLQPIVWRQGLFFLGERPQERVGGPVDITGRAHCLVCGPDIVLPPGWWSLSLTVALTRAAAEHEFLVELVAGQSLGAGIMRPQQQTSAELTIVFLLSELIERPLQLRISTLRAAFDGAIAIDAVTLQRTAPATA